MADSYDNTKKEINQMIASGEADRLAKKYESKVPDRLFSISYKHNGRTFGIHIWDIDEEAANARLKSIRETAYFDGEIYGLIDATTGEETYSRSDNISDEKH